MHHKNGLSPATKVRPQYWEPWGLFNVTQFKPEF